VEEQELRYADIHPDNLSIDAIRQMLAIKDSLDEGEEGIPIPIDSPLGKYLVENSKPLSEDGE